jgi:hypothetical protein
VSRMLRKHYKLAVQPPGVMAEARSLYLSTAHDSQKNANQNTFVIWIADATGYDHMSLNDILELHPLLRGQEYLQQMGIGRIPLSQQANREIQAVPEQKAAFEFASQGERP